MDVEVDVEVDESELHIISMELLSRASIPFDMFTGFRITCFLHRLIASSATFRACSGSSSCSSNILAASMAGTGSS